MFYHQHNHFCCFEYLFFWICFSQTNTKSNLLNPNGHLLILKIDFLFCFHFKRSKMNREDLSTFKHRLCLQFYQTLPTELSSFFSLKLRSMIIYQTDDVSSNVLYPWLVSWTIVQIVIASDHLFWFFLISLFKFIFFLNNIFFLPY